MSTWLVIVLGILAFNAGVLLLAALLLGLDYIVGRVKTGHITASATKRQAAGAREAPANATKRAR